MVDPKLRLALLEQLESLLERGWDCPFQKRKGLSKSPTDKLLWLHKNLGVKNSNHPHYQDAMQLLDKLIK